MEGCPLCGGGGELFHRDKRREFFLCPDCDLVFVPERFHLSPEDEKKRYDAHHNDLADPGYRAFLGRLLDPMLEKLPPGARGLDFGSGPTSSLARLFTEAGRPCASHDLYYASDPAALSIRHDFVVCCEVLEHFRRPAAEFASMLAALKPEGLLGVMTQLRDEAAALFCNWFYKNDLTHICLHSRRSLSHLAAVHGLELETRPLGVSLFQLKNGKRL